MRPVIPETGGNQRFIFSSPRLRDSVGTSSLLTKLQEWTERGLVSTGVAATWCTARGPPSDGRDPHDSQQASKSSGKAIFLVGSAQQAKDIIGAVMHTTLAGAPGMNVSDILTPLPTPSNPQSPEAAYVTESALKEIHAEAAHHALQRPPAGARFSRLLFLTRARDSSMPASPPLSTRDEAKDDHQDALSLISRIRCYRACEAHMHLLGKTDKTSNTSQSNEELLIRDPTKLAEKLRLAFSGTIAPADNPDGLVMKRSIDHAEAAARRLRNAIRFDPNASSTNSPDTDSDDYIFLSKAAVIHIDDNGVGDIMEKLDSSKDRVAPGVFKAEVGCDYDDPGALRRFLLEVSDHLDDAVTLAFAAAWTCVAELSRHNDHRVGRGCTAISVVPVILGGDDVTVITNGDHTLPFAAAYLHYYEETTSNDPILRYLTPPEGQGTDLMTAATGVAIIKRNFPFHIAYELAEELVERAKRVGKAACPPCSALSYHILFGTTVLDASEALRGYESFTTRPFRLLNGETLSAVSTRDDDSRIAGSGDGEDSTPADSSPNDPYHEPQEVTCRYVARFRGMSLGSTDESRSETNLEPFPHTRAACIRGLLSAAVRERAAHRDDDMTNAPTAEAADCETTGSEAPEEKEDQVPPSLRRARNEWAVARKEIGDWVDTEFGSVGAVFDLLELSDPLPPFFFELSLPDLGRNISTASETTE